LIKFSTGIHKKLIYCIFILLSLFTKNNYAQKNLDYELVSIKFEGNKIFSQSELEKIIISKESPGAFSQFLYSFTSFGGKAIYYNPGLINSDISQLKNFYRDKGYFKSKIAPLVNVDSTDNDTELIYSIEAGQPAIVKKYEVLGLENIYSAFKEIINDRVTIELGEQYSAEVVNETRARILNFLGDRGYMTAVSGSPEILVDTLKNEVEVTLNFNPGNRFKISELRVIRNGPGKEEVTDQLLLDLIDIKEGDFYSNEKIQLSQIRLYRTNLFNSALIMPVRKDTVNNTVPLEILTNVSKIYQLTPELIFNNDNQDKTLNLGLALEFTKRNFLGGARKLSSSFSVASTDPLRFIKDLSLSDSLYGYADARIAVEQPTFFGKSINTVYEAYYTIRKRSNEYNSFIYGGKINLNFDLPRFTFVTSLSTFFSYGSEKTDFKKEYMLNRLRKNPSIDSLELNTITKFIDAGLIGKPRSKNATIGVEIGMNQTNDRQLMFPTKGTNLQILLEGGNTFNYILEKAFSYKVKTPEYVKAQFVSSFYFPFFNLEKSVFAFKLKTGIIHVYRGDKFSVPISQRFYSGGANSVRGWRARDLFPESRRNSDIGNLENLTRQDFELILNQNVAPGGFFLLEASAEARIRLIGDFGSAFFLDIGNNWNTPGEFQYKDLGVAAGIGFRYYSPFAPIRLDLGIRIWDPKNNRNVFNWPFFLRDSFSIQIGIGEAF